MGSRPSSRRVTIRLTKLTPQRCWPTTTPPSATLGTRRPSHTGQLRATKTCSVTWTGTTGISMTSRVRCTHPPTRWVPQSGRPPRHAPPAGLAPSVSGRSHEAAVFVPASWALAALRVAYYPACQTSPVCSNDPPSPQPVAAIGQRWPLTRQ